GARARLDSLHPTNPNRSQRLVVEGTSVASFHATHCTLCILTYEYINKVISQAHRQPFSQLVLKRQVRLLRICVHEVLRLRVSEWLEDQREPGRDVVLVDEQRIRQKGVKCLVIGVISQSRDERRWSWRALRRDRGVDQALEDGNGV